MSWFTLINSAASILAWLVETGKARKWITEGEDRQIALSTAHILEMTEFGKYALEQISGLPDPAVDDLLRWLEDGGKEPKQR